MTKSTETNRTNAALGIGKISTDDDGTIRLLLPIKLTNNNDGQSRSWFKSHKHRNTISGVLRLLLRGMTITPPDHKQNIVITRILGRGERLWDADSVLRGNAKQLIDALVEAGFFHDDGPAFIVEAIGRQISTNRVVGPAVEVEIRRAE